MTEHKDRFKGPALTTQGQLNYELIFEKHLFVINDFEFCDYITREGGSTYITCCYCHKEYKLPDESLGALQHLLTGQGWRWHKVSDRIACPECLK
jgi:hypothetical protein